MIICRFDKLPESFLADLPVGFVAQCGAGATGAG